MRKPNKLIGSPHPRVKFGGVVLQSVVGTVKEKVAMVLVSLLEGSLVADAWLLTRSLGDSERSFLSSVAFLRVQAGSVAGGAQPEGPRVMWGSSRCLSLVGW